MNIYLKMSRKTSFGLREHYQGENYFNRLWKEIYLQSTFKDLSHRPKKT